MTLSLCCCHILSFFLFLHFLGSRCKCSLFSMTAGPVGRHFRLVAPPPPQPPATVCQDFPGIPRPPSKTLTYYWLILQNSRPHEPFSMNGTCIDALLPNKVHFKSVSYCHHRSTDFFFYGTEVMSNRDEIFCSYLP